MEAGRELDALVAEKVMGWHRFDNCPGAYPSNRVQCPDVYRCPFFDGEAPAYSTDIAAAWPIAEKFGLTLVASPIGPTISDGVRWRAVGPGIMGHYYGGDSCSITKITLSAKNDVIVIADTAPLAICLAALKAVGVDIDNL